MTDYLSNRHPISSLSHARSAEMDVFDLLVEQQDQEMARNGEISPFTRLQFQAYQAGQPIPQVNVRSPEIQRLTARLLQKTPVTDEEWDDDWWLEGDHA